MSLECTLSIFGSPRRFHQLSAYLGRIPAKGHKPTCGQALGLSAWCH